MADVVPISPNLGKNPPPAELQELKGWLIWRYEIEPGTGKRLKVPYYVNGGRRYGRHGDPKDRAKLTSWSLAKATADRVGADGVGLALMPEFGIVALDFDHCVSPGGTVLPPEVAQITSRTYSEYSPSGLGVRAFVKGDLGNRKSFVNEENAYNIEVFSSSGFVTFTGNVLPSTEALSLSNTVAPVDDTLMGLCRKRFGEMRAPSEVPDDSFLENYEPPLGLNVEEVAAYLSDLDPSMGRDGWIRVGMAVHHETGGEGFDIWDAWSSGGVQYPGTDRLQTQWSSFERRDISSKQVTMRSVLKLSAEARTAMGEAPRSFDPIGRAADEVRASNPDVVLRDECASSEAWEGKYRVVSGADFSDRPPPRWIVKGLLPEADLAVVFGASGSGKSFVVLDIAMAISRGIPWRGLKVRQGRVIYIAAEGGGGVSQRLRAYAMHNKVDLKTVPIGIIHDAPNLLKVDDISALVAAVVDAGSADLIVCDTFAQMMPGANENSGEDVGLALKHARSLRDATGAMILLVHHSGKDTTKGARGWSGLRAASDTELEVVREAECDVRTLRISKQKDGRDDLMWGFGFQEVVVGLDEDGDALTSLAVVEAEIPKDDQEIDVEEMFDQIPDHDALVVAEEDGEADWVGNVDEVLALTTFVSVQEDGEDDPDEVDFV